MPGESLKPASAPTGAVFLSYASQDAEAAQKICEALRAAGIEVWFDQSELRGGDAWDQSIRKQIKTCALFLPIISQHTHERAEGYFRLEWKLAVDRSHLIAADKAFLVPIVIDDTPNEDERVPERFRELQWTRLPDGETSPAFIARIQRLLVPDAPTQTAAPTPSVSTIARASRPSVHPTRASNSVLWVTSVLLATGLAYLVAERLLRPQHSQATPASQKAASSASATSSTADTFNPPPHSIAVLPFVNMSGDKEQEYFSDGLTDELLNSLSRINQLQVVARTSSFSFKGKDVDIGTIARKLNVAAILEGSVRRSHNTVRISAQLDSTVTGFHLWSQTYDRSLGDVLELQTEIASAVANALKVTLFDDVAAKIELGGTRNPAAFDAYLRASKAFYVFHSVKDVQTSIAAYTDAIRLDPQYALAYAGRSRALSVYAGSYATGAAIRDGFDRAQADARQAVTLAPELAEGHFALALLAASLLDFKQAAQAYEKALAFAPSNAGLLVSYGEFAVRMGRSDAGIAAIRQAVTLDPLNAFMRRHLGYALYLTRRYPEAIATLHEALALDPDAPLARLFLGRTYYSFGDFDRARASCESQPDHWCQWVLAVAYDKLGRHADAEAELAKLKATQGDADAYQYVTIYAQWGDRTKALDSLDAAMRVRDSGLIYLKTDPFLDPLRNDPRFQAVMRELKFPE